MLSPGLNARMGRLKGAAFRFSYLTFRQVQD